MKKLISAALIALSIISCQQEPGFKLRGEIEGLQIGDTLLLSSYILPNWDLEVVDTFYVKKKNTVSYNKSLAHTSFFILNHYPKDAKRIDNCIRGASFLAKDEDEITVKGSINYIGALQKKGGFYSNAQVAKLDQLENAYNMELMTIYQKLIRAQSENEFDSLQIFSIMYGDCEPSREYIDLKGHITEDVNDSEYAAFLYLNQLGAVTKENMNKRIQKFVPEVKTSYMVQRLEGIQNALTDTMKQQLKSDTIQ